MTGAMHPFFDQATIEAASAWWLKLDDDPDLAGSEAFRRWYADERNACAFEFVGGSMEGLRGESGTEPWLIKMRSAALTRAEERGGRRYRRRAFLLGGGAVAASAAILGWYGTRENPQTENYATPSAERRDFKLADGSKVTLDADSAISADFTPASRQVMLTRGRAHFDVAHEPSRPFLVTSRHHTVVAIGTSFTVEKLSRKVIISLLEGKVLVRDDTEAGASASSRALTALDAGEQLIFAVDGATERRRINLPSETAWREGRLVFRGAPLEEAVEQVNRYAGHPIGVDPGIAQVPISGVFLAGDVTAFVSAVTAYLPVAAAMEPSGAIILKKRS